MVSKSPAETPDPASKFDAWPFVKKAIIFVLIASFVLGLGFLIYHEYYFRPFVTARLVGESDGSQYVRISITRPVPPIKLTVTKLGETREICNLEYGDARLYEMRLPHMRDQFGFVEVLQKEAGKVTHTYRVELPIESRSFYGVYEFKDISESLLRNDNHSLVNSRGSDAYYISLVQDNSETEPFLISKFYAIKNDYFNEHDLVSTLSSLACWVFLSLNLIPMMVAFSNRNWKSTKTMVVFFLVISAMIAPWKPIASPPIKKLYLGFIDSSNNGSGFTYSWIFLGILVIAIAVYSWNSKRVEIEQ